MGWI